MNKLVSIGIPTYNRPEALESCVKNILNQTYNNIEILISDNNSNNIKNKNLYKSKLFKNPKIKLFLNNKNHGVLKNTINVLNKAKGDYFCWVSDDDWRSSTFLEEMFNDIERLGEGYICFSKYIEKINDCRESDMHLKRKNNLNFLKSNSKFIRKIFYYLLDNANGKCNLFYSLIPTKELRKIDFKKASNNWEDLSMDRNIVQALLTRNKVHVKNRLLLSLTVNNKKYYLNQRNQKFKNIRYKKLFELISSINNETSYLQKDIAEYKIKYFIFLFYLIKCFLLIFNRLYLNLLIYIKTKKPLNKKNTDYKAIKRIEDFKMNTKKIINLNDVSLICVATTEVEKAAMALRFSMLNINFEKVILLSNYNPWNLGEKIEFTRINKFNNVDEWCKFIVFDLYNYIETKYILLIHPDGFVVNPQLWKKEFLNYDFIGAPWPKPKDSFSYRTNDGEVVRVGNSVSIRSKKLLELPKILNLKWKPFFGNYNEDGFLCVHNRKILLENGVKFADKKIAYQFGIENHLSEFKSSKAFTFHKWKNGNKIYPKFEGY